MKRKKKPYSVSESILEYQKSLASIGRREEGVDTRVRVACSRLRMTREIFQLTLSEVGEALGADHGAMSRLETAKAEPKLGRLLAYADHLRIPPFYLFIDPSDEYVKTGNKLGLDDLQIHRGFWAQVMVSCIHGEENLEVISLVSEWLGWPEGHSIGGIPEEFFAQQFKWRHT